MATTTSTTGAIPDDFPNAASLGCEDFVVDVKLFDHLRDYQVKVVLTFHGNIFAFLSQKYTGLLLGHGLIRSGLQCDRLNIYSEWHHYVEWYMEQIKRL